MNVAFETLRADETCGYCGATVSAGQDVARNKNTGEIYGFACHRRTSKRRKPQIQIRSKRTLEEQDFYVAARKYAKDRRISPKGFVRVFIQGNHLCTYCGHEIPKGHIAWISRSNLVYHLKRTQCTMADAAQLSHNFTQTVTA